MTSSPAATLPRLGALALAVTLLSACTVVGDGLLSGDKVDYRNAPTKAQPLEVPPDLSQLARESRYQAQGGVISAAAAAAATPATAPGAAPSAAPATVALNALAGMRIDRDGQQRWLVVPQTPEQLWPQLRAFWEKNGCQLSTDSAATGIMETTWAENRAKIGPADAPRGIIARLMGAVSDTGERDRYRTRVAARRCVQCDAGLLPTDELCLPLHRRMVVQYLPRADGVRQLHLYYGDKEISFDDPAMFPFGEALGALLTRTPAARLLVTARSDYLGRIAMLPGIGDVVSRSLYILRPLGPDKIREVVVGPAHAKGVAFESPALVNELVETTARTDGGLPLLQFALAELWEAREGNRITAAALRAIGGVSGALARHADLVLSSLPPAQRTSARRILMSLVTLEGTRARRTEEELLGADPSARPALEALVRGRLLVAGDTAEGAAYEVAHEALIKGWDTLRRWLEEFAESRAARQRLEAAAAEWRRLGRVKEALWGGRQLAEAAILDAVDIGPREAEFLAASRNRAQRRRHVRNAALLAVPLALLSLYGAVQYIAHQELRRRVASYLQQGSQQLGEARRRNAEIEQLRHDAFTAFDSYHQIDGEALWQQRATLPTFRAHNEQGMAHAAIAYAKAQFRQRIMAVTSSIGPGATNLVTAAALAHVNRLPVLLLPGDVFASRAPDPVLQQLEDFSHGDVSANDAFRPLTRYFDRISRPEQILDALPRALAVMTDPATCGPVCLALPQDVQAQAFDCPVAFLQPAPIRLRRPRTSRPACSGRSSAH